MIRQSLLLLSNCFSRVGVESTVSQVLSGAESQTDTTKQDFGGSRVDAHVLFVTEMSAKKSTEKLSLHHIRDIMEFCKKTYFIQNVEQNDRI